MVEKKQKTYYKKIKTIGKGAFGTVSLVKDEEGQRWAIKQLDIVELDDNCKANIRLEFGLL